MSSNLIHSVTTAHNYQQETVQWVYDALDQTSSRENVESRAKPLLEQLDDNRTDKTRYEFGQPLMGMKEYMKEKNLKNTMAS